MERTVEEELLPERIHFRLTSKEDASKNKDVHFLLRAMKQISINRMFGEPRSCKEFYRQLYHSPQWNVHFLTTVNSSSELWFSEFVMPKKEPELCTAAGLFLIPVFENHWRIPLPSTACMVNISNTNLFQTIYYQY